jgi:hypothetical protein
MPSFSTNKNIINELLPAFHCVVHIFLINVLHSTIITVHGIQIYSILSLRPMPSYGRRFFYDIKSPVNTKFTMNNKCIAVNYNKICMIEGWLYRTVIVYVVITLHALKYS